ncbi:MAG: hypothetical protein ACFBSD_01705 [Paracoccaceae bacterium]
MTSPVCASQEALNVAEVYRAFANLEVAIEQHLHRRCLVLDVETRHFLASLRDAAGTQARLARGSIPDRDELRLADPAARGKKSPK